MNQDLLCINTIRTLAIDAVQKANSGHPGLPLGAAPMAYVLWQKHLQASGKNPTWANRDRFILSAGHGSALLYSLLHLYGYELSLDDLKNFRQMGSKTPGHPEFGLTPGVEATTGPLGQGTANAVGMAMAERNMAARYNRDGFEIINHHTYALVSDGDLMEGISSEAAALAGHLKLGKLIYLYDANDVSLDGPTSLTFTENIAQRYTAHGWDVQTVEKGDTDLDALNSAIAKAKTDASKPHMIIVKTTIGFGSPNKAGTSSSHGSPLGVEEVALTKKALGWSPEQSFFIPAEASQTFGEAIARAQNAAQDWQKLFSNYKAAHPQLAEDFERCQKRLLPKDLWKSLPTFKAGDKIATRKASSEVIGALAPHLPEFWGGDADLGCSTLTIIKSAGDFDAATGLGRNVHYGVREHAMTAIQNGMLYYGGSRPFVATFFCFADYMRPGVRLAALNHLPAIYVWTHDSVFLGEDGPTHQPVEHLMSLRAMPNMRVFRPADANETSVAWQMALEHTHGPTALVLSRQNLPVLDRSKLAPAQGASHGAYVLSDMPHAKAIIIATGSEVQLALAAQEQLQKDGVATRVVSMPSWELFAAQSPAYRESVLPAAMTKRLSLEAGVTFGWERWTGAHGKSLGIDRFGASAPDSKLAELFGFTPSHVVGEVKKLVG